MEITKKIENGELTIFLDGRIDSANAPEIEEEITKIREENAHESLVLDFDNVAYISSSGIRILLRILKAKEKVRVVNTSLEVYEVLEMTGFTELMPVEKALRKMSVDGCEVIGHGAKGIVYRYNQDTIIKVYKKGANQSDVDRERDLAKKAFVLGVPTAIPFGVVRVGDCLGTVFELLDAKSLSELMKDEPENFDKYIETYVSLLKSFHENEADDDIPSIKPLIYSWLDCARTVLEDDEYEKTKKLLDEVPESNTLLHCDYHTNNIMVQNGEALLIDMDTMSKGNVVFDIANVFATYAGFGEVDRMNVENFIGLSYDVAVEIWNRFLPMYMEGESAEKIEEASNAVKVLGYLRVLRHNIRRGALDTEEGKQIVDTALKNFREALSKVSSLAM